MKELPDGELLARARVSGVAVGFVGLDDFGRDVSSDGGVYPGNYTLYFL